MAYRGDDGGHVVEAPTAGGPLRLELGPRRITLTAGGRTIQIADQFVTIVQHNPAGEAKKQESLRIEGRVLVARDVPHEDLGVWIELADRNPGMRRVFGVEPVSLLEQHGLAALHKLDMLGTRLRTALAEYSGDVRRASELGRGLDKVLLVDHGDHHAVYARKLFRDRARLALSIYDNGRMVIVDGPEVVMSSRFGITVSGDYIRFIDRHGTDLARLSIPWITREDREELARRISQLVPS
ncbi:MAG TPA: hypothetical protein VFQ65_06390 [Kofleriaceae bacterium]|nr:hypothetical protein [Kofleriaceae bacterium]